MKNYKGNKQTDFATYSENLMNITQSIADVISKGGKASLEFNNDNVTFNYDVTCDEVPQPRKACNWWNPFCN